MKINFFHRSLPKVPVSFFFLLGLSALPAMDAWAAPAPQPVCGETETYSATGSWTLDELLDNFYDPTDPNRPQTLTHDQLYIAANMNCLSIIGRQEEASLLRQRCRARLGYTTQIWKTGSVGFRSYFPDDLLVFSNGTSVSYGVYCIAEYRCECPSQSVSPDPAGTSTEVPSPQPLETPHDDLFGSAAAPLLSPLPVTSPVPPIGGE